MCFIDDEFEIVNCFKEKVHVPVKVEVTIKTFLDDHDDGILNSLPPVFTEVCCYNKRSFLRNSEKIVKSIVIDFRRKHKKMYKRMQFITSRISVKDDFKCDFLNK